MKSKDECIVVGIGASAGGLDALKKLLETLPDEKNITYVIVQHLEPNRESILTSLLSSLTSIPVVEVKNDDPLLACKVYISPPGCDVSIKNGKFIVHKVENLVAPKPSVNHFFYSLAEEKCEKAIGVILSGTGIDGTLGVQSIKTHGGIVIVQEPDSAKYKDMPKAAIATGNVDFILEPRAIGRELFDIIHSPLMGKVILNENSAYNDMSELLELLYKHTRHDFSGYKDNTIERRIHRRLVIHKLKNIKEYISLVKENPSDLKDLVKDLLISVTSFFRDQEAFEYLKKILPAVIMNKPKEQPVRVWVPGCSSGEEIYSIVILFAEYLGKSFETRRLQFYATDIDCDVVSVARKGVFSKASLINVDKKIIKKYFKQENNTFQIHKAIREQIIFAKQDIINDPPFSRLDLIACRNLLIYLQPELQDRVISMFHYALNQEGILFLGKSESIGRHNDLFESVSKKWRIFRRRNTDRAYSGSFRRKYLPLYGMDKELPRKTPELSFEDITHRVVNKVFGFPSILINEQMQILYIYGDNNKYFHIGQGNARLNVLDFVKKELRSSLRTSISKAQRENFTVISRKNRFQQRDGNNIYITLHVNPVLLDGIPKGYLLVSFEEEPDLIAKYEITNSHDFREQRIVELEQELAAIHERLQATVEELETSNEELQSLNEELQSANEELQSTNEELETSNEELQASNEELITVNEELQVRSSELAEANSDLENVFRRMGIPLIVVDHKLRVRKFTPPVASLFNIMSGDRGQLVTNLGSYIDIPNFRFMLTRVIKNGEPIHHKLETGAKIFDLRIYPYYNDVETINGALISFYDITSAYKREQEFKALAENAPDIVARFDQELRHLYINRTIEKFTGRNRDEFIGKTNWELGMSEDLCFSFERELKKAFITLEESICQFQVLSPDGIKTFEARIAPEYSPTGKVTTLLVISRDITSLKRVENELKNTAIEISRQKELLEAILDNVPALITVYDPAIKMLFINKSFEKKTGWTREEIRTINVMEKCYPDPEVRKEALKYMESAFSAWKEFPFTTKMGTTIDTIWSNVLLEDGTQIGIGVDITERKKIEHVLLKKQKLESLGVLAGGIAHNFNNCLASIIGFAELSMDKNEEREDCSDDLNEIITAGVRARDLVQQILTFSQKIPLKKEVVFVKEIVEKAVKILRASLSASIKIEKILPEEDIALTLNASQLYQVVMNIGTNAAQAMSEKGGVITVKVERINLDQLDENVKSLEYREYMKLSIADTGRGMSPDIVERIFDPYFTTKKDGAGSGLGLSVVHGIVKSFHGEILVDTNFDVGTTFDIYLPITNDKTQTTSSLAVEDAQKGTEKILFVDDEPSIVKMQKKRLEYLGYTMETFTDALAALDRFYKTPKGFDLVITDMTMPKLNGEEFIKAIRSVNKSVPIILCTGHNEKIHTLKNSEVSIDAFIIKPVVKNEMAHVIRAVLEKKK